MPTPRTFVVVGDLIIDHVVFVSHPETVVDAPPGEAPYKVIGRQDTAGGAANTARILAMLYPDATIYLWGILGRSLWGTFRDILHDSQSRDGCFNWIELRGVRDETEAPMNMITRLVLTGEDGVMRRILRFDDSGHAHVTDSKRASLLHHLIRIHQKKRGSLKAIIINDLDRGCMTPRVVWRIARYASQWNVPLFVDPKRDRKKYLDITATAILPNLREWCHLVNDGDNEAMWRANLHDPDTLVEMAERSFYFLRNFTYHIITCDKDGAVIMAPSPSNKNRYGIYVGRPESTREPVKVHEPLGPGDLLTGVVAAEYEPAEGTLGLLRAFQKANLTVTCYREMPYQRMPPYSVVIRRARSLQPWTQPPRAETTLGNLSLPRETHIYLRPLYTEVPGLVSGHDRFRNEVRRLIEALRTGSASSKPDSLRLAAPPGSGKTLIANALKGDFGSSCGLAAVDVELPKIVGEFDAFLDTAVGSARSLGLVPLFIVDETLKDPNGPIFRNRGQMVELLNRCQRHRASFLFVDALFCEESQLRSVDNEILSRCSSYSLPGLDSRPSDIPHIMAHCVLSAGESKGITALSVEQQLLRSVIDYVLTEPGGNTRDLARVAKRVYEAAVITYDGSGTLKIVRSNWPGEIPVATARISPGPERYTYEL